MKPSTQGKKNKDGTYVTQLHTYGENPCLYASLQSHVAIYLGDEQVPTF